MIRYCRDCVYPETKPDLSLDDKGICDACRYVDVNIDFAGPNIPDAKSNISLFFTTVPFILKIPAFSLKYALFLI